MHLTKTDFKEYLLCSKSLWLKKKRPEQYVAGEFSLFLKKLIADGYEVERYVQKLFPEGVVVSGDRSTMIAMTQELVTKKQTLFQATFETPEGLFAEIDILRFNDVTGRYDIYEVKASSEIKTDLKHNHIKDVGFQTLVVERALGRVGESYIIYINKDYRRQGEIDIHALFLIENVSERVRKEKPIVVAAAAAALSLLHKDDLSLVGCDCFYRSAGQRCDSFFLFHPEVPEYSVHHVVTGKKLQLLLSDGIVAITDIPDDYPLTPIQRAKVDLQKSGQPAIERAEIMKTLDSLTYPFYFLDYETYGTPIPILDQYKTNQQIVFQVSLHVLMADGTLTHHEYLAPALAGATLGLVRFLKEHIAPVGTVIVWYAGFEKARNRELAALHPEYQEFLENVNTRVFDLMEIFKKEYLHPAFEGSASIKKVLPVLLPELSYTSLDIQNGTMALSEWEKIIKGSLSEAEVAQIKKNLLTYCALDTFAMVEIFRFLKRTVKEF